MIAATPGAVPAPPAHATRWLAYLKEEHRTSLPSVILYPDGRLYWQSQQNTVRDPQSWREGQVTPAALQKVKSLISQSRFFSREVEPRTGITDAGTTGIGVSLGGKTRNVYAYALRTPTYEPRGSFRCSLSQMEDLLSSLPQTATHTHTLSTPAIRLYVGEPRDMPKPRELIIYPIGERFSGTPQPWPLTTPLRQTMKSLRVVTVVEGKGEVYKGADAQAILRCLAQCRWVVYRNQRFPIDWAPADVEMPAEEIE